MGCGVHAEKKSDALGSCQRRLLRRRGRPGPVPGGWKAMTTTATATLPAPGLHRGLSFDDYARWAAINNSTLKLFARSAAHAHEAMIAPGETTDALAIGE